MTNLSADQPDFSIDLDDGTDEKISIIIVHKDRPALLNLCLQSIVVASVNNNIELIVIDNASVTQDAIDYMDVLSKQEDVKVIKNENNKWWAEACNQGAKAADKKSKYLVFMHQDCVVLNPSWLDLMVSLCESHNTGYLGLEQSFLKYGDKPAPFVADWCLMVSRECWNDCGPFHGELKQVGSSFITTLIAQKKGYKPMAVGKLQLVHHYSAMSMDVSAFEKNREQSSVLMQKLIRDIQIQQSS